MDYQTKFLCDQSGEIYAICPVENSNHTVIKDVADIRIVATGTNPKDAHALVRQLNSRMEFVKSYEKHNRKVNARLLKAYRTNSKLRREVKRLKAGK